MNSKGSKYCRRRREQAALLDFYYRRPDPMDSESQWERYAHHDLRIKTRPELLFDQARLGNRLMYDPHPHPWFLERWDRIEEALGYDR